MMTDRELQKAMKIHDQLGERLSKGQLEELERMKKQGKGFRPGVGIHIDSYKQWIESEILDFLTELDAYSEENDRLGDAIDIVDFYRGMLRKLEILQDTKAEELIAFLYDELNRRLRNED